jgi:hypothetical protein
MPHLAPRRRHGALIRHQQRQAQRSEALHVQALLSALRASIVNQLEEAELRVAMRESMENYKPTMNPACKQSIADLEDMLIVAGTADSADTADTADRADRADATTTAAAPQSSRHSHSSSSSSSIPTAEKAGATGAVATVTIGQLDEPTCPICTEDYAVGDTVVKALPQCKHGFHSACIKQWFNVNDTCPICRAVLPAKCGACEENQKFAREMLATQERRRSSRVSNDDDDDDADDGNGGASAAVSGAAVSEAAVVAEAAVAEAVAAAAFAASSATNSIRV